MAKALKIAAIGLGVTALAFTGVGLAVGMGTLATSFGFGVSASTLFLASAGASAAASLLQKAPKVPSSQTDRLTASIDPRAFRKTILGQTAWPADVRFEEWSGKDQEYCDWVVGHASHACESLDEIWFNTEMAWSATTGVTAKYRGYFNVIHTVLEGSPANAFAINSGRWNQNARLTGCAYSHWRFKVTGNSKKAESPFSSGLPSRITVIGRGAKLYDPRRDSTVPGGNGPMRADDQSTWRYTADDGVVIGENLALHILRVVLGWRIRNPSDGAMKLATGSGVPARRLDLGSFIVAANLCDELVNRSAGGQEPRYHGASVVSEGDDAKTVLDMLCAACCGRFRDTGGKLALVIAHNDLALAAVDDGLNDDDVIGAFTWNPDAALEAIPNVVRGKYVDATANSLYQMIDYPEVRLASLDGQDRTFPLDLGAVESPSHAQRVAKQVLQRKQYPREFSAPFDIRAWKYAVGDPVPFTFAPLSFTRALFRVKEQELGQNGTCNMTLTYESASFYQWDASDALPVQAAEAIVYNASNSALIQAIGEAGTTANWSAVADDDGMKPEDGATVGAPAGTDVGGRPALTVIQQIDKANADIAGLIAAASENQTDLSEQVNAANIARDAAQTARDQSQAARDAAAAAQAAASDSAKASAVSVSDTKSFAQTASGAATTATQKADAAGSSAATATAKADIASTKAGEASVSAGQASTSASNAQGSASSAATAQALAATARDAANSTAYAMLPSTFDQDGAMWSPYYSGPVDRSGFDYHYVFNATQERTLIVNADGSSPTYDVAHRGLTKLVPGTTLRLTATWRVRSAAGAPTSLGTLYFIGCNSVGTSSFTPGKGIKINGAGNPGWSAQGGWAVDTYDFSADALIATANGAATHVRGLMRFNKQQNGEQWELQSLKLSDVTSEIAAAASASAANTSASSAAASKDAAGTSASAANQSKLDAQTALGQAGAARDTAVTSASNAAGSANAAATQATLSARAAADAGSAALNDNRVPGAARSLWSINQYNSFVPDPAQTLPALATGAVGYNAATGDLVMLDAFHVHPIKPTRIDPNRRIRCVAKVKRTLGADTIDNTLYLTLWDKDGNLLNGNTNYIAGGVATSANGPEVTIEATLRPSVLNANAAFARVMYRSPGGYTQVNQVYLEDVESAQQSADSASASNASASSASASKDAAGSSATAANQSRIDAQAANGAAQGAAGVASSSAAAANASASQAQTSATLSASFTGSVGTSRNEKFAAWPAGQALPNDWAYWSMGGNFRVANTSNGYASSIQTLCDAQDVETGLVQYVNIWAGLWIMEATVRMDANVYDGAGLTLHGQYSVLFASDPDTQGVTNDNTAGRVRTFSKVISISQAFVDSVGGVGNFHMMHQWSGFGNRAPKYLTWLMARLRPLDGSGLQANANASRIEQVNRTLADQYGALAQRVSSTEATAGSLSARTGITESAVADLRTKSAAARLEFSATSPGGRAAVTIRSDSNNGAGIDLVGDVAFTGNQGGAVTVVNGLGVKTYDANGNLVFQCGIY